MPGPHQQRRDQHFPQGLPLRYLIPELPLSGAPGFPMAHLPLLSCNLLFCPVCLFCSFFDVISQNHSGLILVRRVTKQFNSQFYNNPVHLTG